MSTFGATIEIVDVQTRSRTKLTGHLRHVGAVRFSPDGKRLAGAGSGANDALKLWDVESRRELLTLQVTIGDGYSNRQIEWSPDGNSILMMGGDGRVSIWSVPSVEEIERLEKQQNLIADTNTGFPE